MYTFASVTKTRTTILAVVLTVLVGAAPAVACLAMTHQAPVVDHAPAGCDSSPHAPSATLCAISGTVVPADGPAAPTPLAIGFVAAYHPGEGLALERGAAAPPPRARSAPIHLLHATFLI